MDFGTFFSRWFENNDKDLGNRRNVRSVIVDPIDFMHIRLRAHSSLDDRTPDEVYYDLPHPFNQAA